MNGRTEENESKMQKKNDNLKFSHLHANISLILNDIKINDYDETSNFKRRTIY